MLVHQGAASFTLWSGREAPRAIMAGAVGYSGHSGKDD
jgi:shikimate 5-dehydrogenase